MKQSVLFLALISLTVLGSAQSDRDSETDSVVVARIAEWQDLKFGFMAHWGMYSCWGVVE